MVVVPIPQQTNGSRASSDAEQAGMDLVDLAAGGTLLVGAILMLAGRRRAGTVAAASGAALALLNQQETLRTWWLALPGYIDEVQRVLGKVQNTINEAAEKRQTLGRILSR